MERNEFQRSLNDYSDYRLHFYEHGRNLFRRLEIYLLSKRCSKWLENKEKLMFLIKIRSVNSLSAISCVWQNIKSRFVEDNVETRTSCSRRIKLIGSASQKFAFLLRDYFLQLTRISNSVSSNVLVAQLHLINI